MDINMKKLEEIKSRMKSFTDFYGGDLLDISDIEACETKSELADIIERHRDHMECMLCDANSHLNSFKREIGL